MRVDGSTCRFAAHNCYGVTLAISQQRLEAALRLGVGNVEVDVIWEPSIAGLVVSHAKVPSGPASAIRGNGDCALTAHLKQVGPTTKPLILTVD